MKSILLITLLFFASSSRILCVESTKMQDSSAIGSLEWLLGTWENETSSGLIYEKWTQISPSEYQGKSYAIKGVDTIIFETLRIVAKDKGILYIPAVRDQNKGNPVVFESSYISPGKFIVEAPEHDFPQVISYTQIAPDRLVAEISGPSKDGQWKYQTFAMKRSSANIALIKLLFHYFNQHNWEEVVKLYAEFAEIKDPATGMKSVLQTRDAILENYMKLNKNTPDIADEIENIYESDKGQVIVEYLSTGTLTDGSVWTLPIVSIFSIENNMIKKDFTYYDKP
ncbi:MAG: SnoaL-like domain-containing protein [Saprospiraceae bacterium]|nr:SnoaL-like domain-containing protein [Saprospiraceae bacterium]